MNKITIGILSFVAGAAVGGVSTFFIFKKRIQKQSEIYIQTQLEEDRKALREKYDDVITEKKDEIAEDAIDQYCEEVRKERREYREAAKKYQTADTLFTPWDMDDPKVQEALDKSKVNTNEPYVITEKQHNEGSYDVKLLYYHPDAYDVADEMGQLVDPAEYVSSRIFNEFAEDDSLDELWVRNDYYKYDVNLIKEVVSR